MKFLKLLLLVTTFVYAGFGNIKGQPLTAAKAFIVTAEQKSNDIEVKIVLAEKVHLSADSLKFRIVKPDEVELDVKLPKSHNVDVNGKEVYEDKLVVKIPLKDIYAKVSEDYTLAIDYSGCSDNGVCYTGLTKEFNFKGNPNPQSLTDKIKSALNQSNPMAIVDILVNENSFFVILLFLIMGLFLALTPCIFPMIPILSSIIVSQQSEDEKPSALKGFFISLVYVLSMAITYTLVGIIAGVLGADLQTAMQSPWVLTLFAIMFFALAISLFGYYEIQLPVKWQSKINAISDNAQGSGIIGTAIMGFLSAFIIGPCVAPPLAGAIMFISNTGNAMLGGAALFAMSMGMGLPLLLVGAGAGKFMPRPGGWMTVVSQTFGVVMLGLAIFMIAKVLPDGYGMLLWSLLFMGTSFYMGVFNGAAVRSGAKQLFQLLAFVFLLYGIILFLGFVSGASSMFSPLEKFTSARGVALAPSVKLEAKQGYSIERLQKEVNATDKPVFVDVRKKTCPSCDELEHFTLKDPKVAEELKRFKVIVIDITNATKDEKALEKFYGIWGTPGLIFFDKDGNHLKDKTMVGFQKADKFLQHIKSIN